MSLTLHAWPTPNSYKISIMLEECGLEYDVKPVHLFEGEQHGEEFLTLNPNGKMPVLQDNRGPGDKPITIFESGAILIYLAEKTGQFYPASGPEKYTTLQWLMWQMAGFGPMLGQAHHFRQYAPEKIEYGIERYTNEANRLYDVLEKRLDDAQYLAGDDYSIADMATYPWALSFEKQGVELSTRPNVMRWMSSLGSRDAVKKGLTLMQEHKRDPAEGMTENERKVMFGK